MEKFMETPRLLLRPLEWSDDRALFLLDSDPAVHLYLGNQPVTSMAQVHEVLRSIHGQYEANGIGRWAVVEKASGAFAGWCGLKIERNVNGRESFYDFGYRLRREFWGKGYATESGKHWIAHGFDDLGLREINAYTDRDNTGSRNVLEKCGLRHTEDFEQDGSRECWYEIHNPRFESTRFHGLT